MHAALGGWPAIYRASTSIASPLTAAIATRWIETGVAASILKATRQESMERQRMLTRLLPSYDAS